MILYKGIKIKCDCKVLPPKGYSAITLFGTVYTRRSEETVQRYLETENGKQWINHEWIHILQKQSLHSWILFYILYLFYFFKMWPFCTTSWNVAYHTIPFELESYINQSDLEYDKSKWKKYVKTNKERMQYKY